MSLLEIQNLCVEFGDPGLPMRAVADLNLSVDRGEVVAMVGESGSGKSVAMLALLGLIDAPGRVRAETLRFDGHDLQSLNPAARRQLLGRDVAMIFQDAQSSLNPAYTVGFQIMETLRLHLGLSKKAARQRALELLELVEIPAAASRLDAFAHQLSGGMCQRVMIAMAIACNPKLLIADEPTTALDVTVQAQIMDLLVALQKSQDMALILISHDLAIVAEVAQRVAVMYAGEIVEINPVPTLFERPRHPYTQALLAAIPESGAARLTSLPGVVPGQHDRPSGCLLAPRCPYVQDRCLSLHPDLLEEGGHWVRCHTPLDRMGRPDHAR